MEKKLLLQENGKTQEIKEINILNDAQNLKMMLGSLSWNPLKLPNTLAYTNRKFTTTFANSTKQAQ